MARFVPFIVDAGDNQKIGVQITRMKKTDAAQTEKEPHWQTSWMSEYIQSNSFEKYALKTADGELVALAAYEILENDVMVPSLILRASRRAIRQLLDRPENTME